MKKNKVMKKLTILSAIVIILASACERSPEASFHVTNTVVDVYENVYFTNTSYNADFFRWDFGDGNTSADENPTHTYANVGTYAVSLTATYINCNDVASHDVSIPLVGIHSYSDENFEAVTLFPNPTSGLINIRLNELINGTLFVTVYNTIGKAIHSSVFENLTEKEKLSLDISDQPKGIYFIKITSTNHETDQKIMLY